MTQRHILVVEDNPSLQDVFERVLVKYDYRVTVIGDGAEALDYLKACIIFPDLIILDVNLPNVSGLYLLKYLRTKLHRADVKVMLATANQITASSPESQMADKFVLKPIPPRQLVEIVSEMLPDQPAA